MLNEKGIYIGFDRIPLWIKKNPVAKFYEYFNLLKPTGYVMHQLFNILKPTGYVMHQQFKLLKPTGYVMHQL